MLCFLPALPVWAQTAFSPEEMSQQQRADYSNLMRGYAAAFRVLGRAERCRLDFDPEPYRREVARRHGEKSEAVKVAAVGYAAGAGDYQLDRELEPVPSAPMPCDVVVYMREMRLPELPASLAPER